MHSADIAADQHLHQEGKELRPGLGPVPVGDGGHSVRHAGAHFADGLPQAARQQLSDGGFGLEKAGQREGLFDDIQEKPCVDTNCGAEGDSGGSPGLWFQEVGTSPTGNTSESPHTASG